MIPGIIAGGMRRDVVPRVLWTPANLASGDLSTWLDAADASTLVVTGGVLTAWQSKVSGTPSADTEYGGPLVITEPDGLASVNVTGAVMSFADSKTLFKNLHSTSGSVFSVTMFGASENPNQLISLFSNSQATATKVGVQIGYEDRAVVSQGNNSVCIRVGRGATAPNRVAWDFNDSTTTFAQYRNRITPALYQIGHWALDAANANAAQRGRFARNGDTLSGGSTYTYAPSTSDAAHDAAINASAAGDRTTGFYGLPLRVREMLVTAHALGFADVQRIEGYMAHKWGLAGDLPSGHPYKNAPPYVE